MAAWIARRIMDVPAILMSCFGSPILKEAPAASTMIPVRSLRINRRWLGGMQRQKPVTDRLGITLVQYGQNLRQVFLILIKVMIQKPGNSAAKKGKIQKYFGHGSQQNRITPVKKCAGRFTEAGIPHNDPKPGLFRHPDEGDNIKPTAENDNLKG